jgi:hypothetical protein
MSNPAHTTRNRKTKFFCKVQIINEYDYNLQFLRTNLYTNHRYNNFNAHSYQNGITIYDEFWVIVDCATV